ncbi:HPF/RaiA family ribosome-associated protein [Roseibium marinum]|uniref:Cold-shock-like DNA binding protein n=1 Tax=Roseibium marinum TaxID=281252 RepID=A0A2S3UP21_9HYPH|nr:HPF/RaiA family ribosome-associated protein [Roseibium marinum]POF29446.1 cold-shock-like DNA binding protein [Roseibium marinum]
MQVEPQVTFRGVEPSPHVEAKIRERIEKLEEFHGRITACQVTVEVPHRHGQKGEIYKISIDIQVPGRDIVVNREPGKNHAHEDILVAVRDAFDAAQRQHEDHVRKTGGVHVKSHPGKAKGKVTDLFRDEAYGFIEEASGQRFFFRADSVTGDDWPRIEIGSTVHFTEMEGEEGPHAVAVTIM